MSRSTEATFRSDAPVVVVGDIEVARVACTALRAAEHEVRHLLHPSDAELSSALTPDVTAVAVLVRGDVTALRYALLTEHLRPGVRLVVTLFDRTVGEQLIRVVPNCRVTSPADVAVPTIVGGCLADNILAVDSRTNPPVLLRDGATGVSIESWKRPESRLRSALSKITGQLHTREESANMMLLGLTGLATVLMIDWILTIFTLHEPGIRGFFTSARVLATVGPANAHEHAPEWYLLVATGLMLATIALTAVFTAGLVNRFLSPRYTSIVGPRTLPRREHVVVVGLGQVGIRLCLELRALGLRVLAVERNDCAPNLRLAKAAGIPVLLGNAADRRLLERLALGRARALAAMGSDDLDNVAVAIAALAVVPDLRIVLRAGEGDVVNETQSLFRIGQVRDVSALTVTAVTRDLFGNAPEHVYQRGHRTAAYAGNAEVVDDMPARCPC